MRDDFTASSSIRFTIKMQIKYWNTRGRMPDDPWRPQAPPRAYSQPQRDLLGERPHDARNAWWTCAWYQAYTIEKHNIQYSCETKNVVETHLCKLCVILRSRAYYWVSSLRIRSATPLITSLYQGQQGEVHQSVRRD